MDDAAETTAPAVHESHGAETWLPPNAPLSASAEHMPGVAEAHAPHDDREARTRLLSLPHELIFEERGALMSPLPSHGEEAFRENDVATGGVSTRRPSSRRCLLHVTVVVLAFCVVAATVGVVVYALLRKPGSSAPDLTAYQRACTVFCSGPLLEAVQSAGIWNDSKTFVDMALLVDPEDALEAFTAQFGSGKGASKEQLEAFVLQYFAGAGTDTSVWVPPDFQMYPPQIVGITNETMRSWALGLNDLWVQLGRIINQHVLEYPQRYTLVYQPYGMIVPGGRFLENYYWDSYWIVLGLLRSGMEATATGMVLNLVHLFDVFGFVPNGARVYYALPGRSQPPMLTHMADAVYEVTRNLSFVAAVYDTLVAEYSWWMQPGNATHLVGVCDPLGNCSHRLNRYVTHQFTPRPESWLEDVHTAQAAGYDPDSESAELLYRDIAAAAESGWDFSSRWFADGETITTCDTSDVVPVDLNAILYGVEAVLSRMGYDLQIAATGLCTAAHPFTLRAVLTADFVQGEGMSADVSAATLYQHVSEALPPDQRSFCGEVMFSAECRNMTLSSLRRLNASDPRYPRTVSVPAPLSHLQELADEPHNADALGLMHACAQAFARTKARDAASFADAARARAAALESVMWSEPASQWFDQRLKDMVVIDADGTEVFTVVASSLASVSNFVPLWSGAFDVTNTTRVSQVCASVSQSALLRSSGLASTAANTSEQWDWPNGWAPLQHMIVLGLNSSAFGCGVDCADPEGRMRAGTHVCVRTAEDIARAWLRTNLVGYEQTSYMFEKYDVTLIGEGGGGGEYVPQTGFGWTNGVALDLLVRYNFDNVD